VVHGNVFDGNASGTRQLGGALAHSIAKRFGRSGIVASRASIFSAAPNRPCSQPSSVPASISLVSAAPTYCRSSGDPLPPPYPDNSPVCAISASVTGTLPGACFAKGMTGFPFAGRCFQDLNPQTDLAMNWHLEVIAVKLTEVRAGKIRRLIINMSHHIDFIEVIFHPTSFRWRPTASLDGSWVE
jgi:hypothetical protein